MDLNSDLGEGYGAWRMGDDEAMLAIVSSANVACGFHAGDPAARKAARDPQGDPLNALSSALGTSPDKSTGWCVGSTVP